MREFKTKSREIGKETSRHTEYLRPKPKKADDILTYRLSQMSIDANKKIDSAELAKIGTKDIKPEHIDQSIRALDEEFAFLFAERMMKTEIKHIIEWDKLINKCDDARKGLNNLKNKIGEDTQVAESYLKRLEKSNNRYLSGQVIRLKETACLEKKNRNNDEMQIDG